MSPVQSIIIVCCFTFSGWALAWLLVKLLFWPEQGMGKLQGVVPGYQKVLAVKAGELVKYELMEKSGLEDKLSNPGLLNSLRPDIEQHIDHFLQEKIKSVFPLLAPFIGEKTINQFKAALLSEIDSLFPLLMKKYSGVLKHDLQLDLLVENRINELDRAELKKLFYANAGKQIMGFRLFCTFFGFVAGLATLLILYIVTTY